MCLAVPMRIKSVDGYEAVCEAKGIERAISLFMLQASRSLPATTCWFTWATRYRR